MSSQNVAVIADVIRSRSYGDRSAVQRDVERMLRSVTAAFPPVQGFSPTVGDELQAVYSTRNEALAATLYAGLLHEQGPELRFGLGQGETYSVTSGSSESIQDGPGWWRAREAVEVAEQRQARTPHLRSRFLGPQQQDDALANAYLLARDHVLASMTPRARRYARGVLEGKSQKQIAAELGVSQSAVSQALRSSGAAGLIAGLDELRIKGREDSA